MNLTENQIKALPLEERQKLVVELKGIQPSDKAYPNAKAIIELITGDKKYKEPEVVKVKALENVPVDGADVKKDQVVSIFPWQYRALARFFEKVAVVLALGLGLLAMPAQAQRYDLTAINGFNGGTNSIATNGIVALATAVTTTTIITNPVVTISNGTPVFSYSYTTNTVTTTPGLINMTRYDGCSIEFSMALNGSGTTPIPVPMSVSDDGTNFQSIGWLSLTPAATAQVTVLTNITSFMHGYLLLGNITNWCGAVNPTNVTLLVAKKTARNGP